MVSTRDFIETTEPGRKGNSQEQEEQGKRSIPRRLKVNSVDGWGRAIGRSHTLERQVLIGVKVQTHHRLAKPR